LPLSAKELSVASDANLQLILMGWESASTLTVPLPTQLPANDFRKVLSAAWAGAAMQSTAAASHPIDFVMIKSFNSAQRETINQAQARCRFEFLPVMLLGLATAFSISWAEWPVRSLAISPIRTSDNF
jgi:hypothetical protein